jgi:serine/threonine-protein kinase RsbT
VAAVSQLAYRYPIAAQQDVEQARREARRVALILGLDGDAVEAVALAVSELGANLIRYASCGEIVLLEVQGEQGRGIQVESRDSGPGIADVALALRDGYSTGGGLGNGLPAVQRLMDEFDLTTGPAGTTITTRKWARRHS